MKPLTKEELENCYVEQSKEAFHELLFMGFTSCYDETFSEKFTSNNFMIVIQDGEVLSGNRENKKQAYFHSGNFYAEPYQEEEKESCLTKKQQYDISSVINSLGALMFFEETTIEVAAQLGRSIVVLEKLMDEEEQK